MRRMIFETDKFCHIYNRGLDKRDIFNDQGDYIRFLNGLYYFNDNTFEADNFKYQGLTLVKNNNREELVHILAWCLMPNHYHLILSQRVDMGVTRFMRRLGTAYTMYSNIKYKHSGHIFQGPFKAKLIERDDYLSHLTRYIHLNPLDLHDINWRDIGVKDMEASKKFILSYKWSSLANYLGRRNLPEIINIEKLEGMFDFNSSEYPEFLWEWLRSGVPSILRSDLSI